LGKVAGVSEATVNLATEKATVNYDPALASVDELRAAVERAGYGWGTLEPAPSAPILTPAPEGDTTFPVEGMTCASCVRRIEKSLAKTPGVREATVNLATEQAHVTYDPAVASFDDLRAAVEKAGYAIGQRPAPAAATTSAQSGTAAAATDEHERQRQRELDDLKRK